MNPNHGPIDMYSLSGPLLGFWAPLALLCLAAGFWLTDRKDWRKKLVMPIGLLSVVLMGYFGAETRGGDAPETALLAVLLHMIGPVAFMAIGTLIATFSGPSPVGPLPPGLRPMGFVMAYGGLAWIGWMLITEPPSAIANGIGQTIWGAWVDVFVSLLILIAALAGSFCVMMGDERHKEAITLAILTIAGGLMFIEIMRDGTQGLEAAGWHQIHWQEMMFLIGGLAGMFSGILAFIGLVYMAEKRAPDPDVVAPLTEDEKAAVDSILRSNLGIGGAEE